MNLNMFRNLFFCFLLLFISNVHAADKKIFTKHQRMHPLDIVFCLDLSGSTNGLIDDVREQLWTITNQVYAMQPVPDLRLGIIGFSRPIFGKESAYVKILSDLTTDFDSLAYELFKLRPAVEKGDQYVNAALNVAMNEMSWGKEQDVKKIIFIVGNGLASIHGIDLEKTCSQLVKQQITVNSLFVVGKGKTQLDAIAGWRKVADLTGGLESEIAVGKKDAVTDVDMHYSQLYDQNKSLNKTYLYHGESGKQNFKRLHDLDSATYLSGMNNFYQRVFYKCSPRFQNLQSHWDLIDYLKSAGGYPDNLNFETLPDSLKHFTGPQLQDAILNQKLLRDRLLREIDSLFKDNYVQKIHQKFINHEFPDGNIFSRCVVNMLLKEWK